MKKIKLFFLFVFPSLIIFFSYFILENTTLEVLKISSEVEENLYFVYNPSKTNIKESDDVALYIFSYETIDDKVYNKLILNSKALNYKLPYYFGQAIAQFDYDKNLEKNILYTNKEELANYAIYKPYFTDISIHNMLFDIEVCIDFIEVSDDITFDESSFLITENNGQYENYNLNEISTTYFVCDTSGFKKNINYQYELFNTIINISVAVPIFIFLIIILNSVSLWFKSYEMDIVVDKIFYGNKKLRYIISIEFIFFLSYMVSYIIVGLIYSFNFTNVYFFAISCLLLMILIFIFSFKIYDYISKKGIKNIYA